MREQKRGNEDRWFTGWFIFCAVMALASAAGLVWLVIDLLPHVTGMMDRLGQ